MGDVEADQVEQLERPHAKTETVLEDAIDLRRGGNPLAQDTQCLRAEGPPGMIDQETRRVRRRRGKMSRVRGQRRQALDHLRIGQLTTYHFDDLHQWHRIEKVKPGHPLRMPAGTGNQAHRQG
ncbi:hypothetical protein D3C84_1049950 [compost metagenome]